MHASAASPLQLLGSFSASYTGAERELLDIQRLVAGRRPVNVWSDIRPHRDYAAYGISTIQPFTQQFPKDGVLLIAGVHVRPAVWLKYTRFERVVIVYNLASHGLLFSMIEGVREATGLEPELVFVSAMLQSSVGLPGRVARSLMDLQPFMDVAAKRVETMPSSGDLPAAGRPFTVGRVSRDSLDKHHPDDPALYRMLASKGVRVRIMGGTCLAPALEGVEGVELCAAGAEPAPDFYGSLDAFVYRTGTAIEGYGRVILEAMASGLPVVAHHRGGYAEVIEHGRNGFLFHTQEQAYDVVMDLQASPALRAATGAEGMRRAVELHGPQAVERELDFYWR
jgi:glycosyltransferase involved in cell wall biosynthesis